MHASRPSKEMVVFFFLTNKVSNRNKAKNLLLHQRSRGYQNHLHFTFSISVPFVYICVCMHVLICSRYVTYNCKCRRSTCARKNNRCGADKIKFRIQFKNIRHKAGSVIPGLWTFYRFVKYWWMLMNFFNLLPKDSCSSYVYLVQINYKINLLLNV